MSEDAMQKNGRFNWLYRIASFILLVIIAYYLIVEHTAHLIQYAGLFAFFLLIILLIIVRFGMLQNDENEPFKEK